MPKPTAEVDIDDAVVGRLLHEQCPDLAHLPLRRVGEGWDNVLYRLGDDLAVRLPRRALGAGLMANEVTWLPTSSRALPLPTSAPVRSRRSRAAATRGRGRSWPGTRATPPRPRPRSTSTTRPNGWARSSSPSTDPPRPKRPGSPFRGVTLAERAPFLTRTSTSWGLPSTRPASARSGTTSPAPPPGRTPRCGCTATCTPSTSSSTTGCCRRSSTSATSARATRPATSRWPGCCSRPVLGTGSGLRSPSTIDTWRRAFGWAIALGAALATGDGRVRIIGHRTLAAVLAEDAPPDASATKVGGMGVPVGALGAPNLGGGGRLHPQGPMRRASGVSGTLGPPWSMSGLDSSRT